MRSSLLASVEVMEFQTTEAYSNLDLTKVKYNTYRHSREGGIIIIYLRLIEQAGRCLDYIASNNGLLTNE
jgi:hypothetical protein